MTVFNQHARLDPYEWDSSNDEELKRLRFHERASLETLAKRFNLTEAQIKDRLTQMGVYSPHTGPRGRVHPTAKVLKRGASTLPTLPSLQDQD